MLSRIINYLADKAKNTESIQIRIYFFILTYSFGFSIWAFFYLSTHKWLPFIVLPFVFFIRWFFEKIIEKIEETEKYKYLITIYIKNLSSLFSDILILFPIQFIFGKMSFLWIIAIFVLVSVKLVSMTGNSIGVPSVELRPLTETRMRILLSTFSLLLFVFYLFPRNITPLVISLTMVIFLFVIMIMSLVTIKNQIKFATIQIRTQKKNKK